MSGIRREKLARLICAGIATLALAGSAKATLINSESVVKDGIEYYMQTDKSAFNLGENVQMLYRVTNLMDEDVTFGFMHGPEYRQCDFIVERNGETIWDTTGWPVTGAHTGFILNPSESKEYTQFWNMTYNNGDQIMQGIYDITGVLSYYTGHERYVPVSVQVEIIPEPTSLLLLGMGLAGLLSRRKR